MGKMGRPKLRAIPTANITAEAAPWAVDAIDEARLKLGLSSRAEVIRRALGIPGPRDTGYLEPRPGEREGLMWSLLRMCGDDRQAV